MAALLALLIFITSSGIAAGSESDFPYDKIRLPGNMIPVTYQLYLHPNITDGKFGITGHVRILVDVKEDTDSIILHSLKLTHHHTEVSEHKDGLSSNKIPVKGTLTNDKHEQVMIQLGEKLSKGKSYVIYIQFSGKLQESLRGFYKSSYEPKPGEKRYLATSHFEPTGARLAFPCFDEPAMKAKFSIIMVREKIHSALSNMPVDKHRSRKDGLIEDHFQQSVRMSTYLVAFVVSDFAHLSTTSKRGVKIRVWAPKHMISQAEYAIKVTPLILDHYEDFFKINFPLPKQDLIAIPDFAAGAMENWGLITYRLTALLYDKMHSSSSNKQRVAVVIAHELAHQWFGNLVTMKWWNDLWLNEGFAAFVEFIGTDHVAKSWQMFDQFALDNVQSALALDSKLNSHPISVPVKDPAEIAQLFDTISYQKGSSIIRMMQDFIGPDRFRNGLAAYLKKYKFGNAASNDLWSSLSKATGGSINVKKIMDTWTVQMGYPVINVIRDPNDNEKAILTQERFVSDVKDGNEVTKVSPFNYKWEVPLTYYYQHNKKEQRNWLHLEDKNLKISWKTNAGWLKINVNEIGVYRVNYDTENWRALAAQLKEDPTKLSPADRSNLIDDAFALANAGKLTQVQALDLTEYLKKEKEYVPFVTGLSALGHIGRLLLHRRGHKSYVKYVLQQISPLVHALGWKDTGSHLNKFLRSTVLHTAVSYNIPDAVKAARDMYNAWMVDGKDIPTNLRSSVYLAGIKYGGQKEWDYMYQKYKTSIYPSEKKTLMYALADTSNPAILKRYLEYSLNLKEVRKGDTSQLIGRIAANPLGTKMARNFVMANWHIIFKRYGVGMTDCGRIIKSAFARGKTQAELDEAQKFLTTHKLGSGTLAAKQTLSTIRNNMNWLAHNERSVESWLERKV